MGALTRVRPFRDSKLGCVPAVEHGAGNGCYAGAQPPLAGGADQKRTAATDYAGSCEIRVVAVWSEYMRYSRLPATGNLCGCHL